MMKLTTNLLPLLVTLFSAPPAMAARQDGIVLINVEYQTDAADSTPSVPNKLYLKNLDTGKKYASFFNNIRYPRKLQVPAGTYCVHSFETYILTIFEFCDSPTFQVKSGEITNAGHWRFFVSYSRNQFKILYALKEPEETLAAAKIKYPKLFDGDSSK